jgi:hypothetical protein
MATRHANLLIFGNPADSLTRVPWLCVPGSPRVCLCRTSQGDWDGSRRLERTYARTPALSLPNPSGSYPIPLECPVCSTESRATASEFSPGGIPPGRSGGLRRLDMAAQARGTGALAGEPIARCAEPDARCRTPITTRNDTARARREGRQPTPPPAPLPVLPPPATGSGASSLRGGPQESSQGTVPGEPPPSGSSRMTVSTGPMPVRPSCATRRSRRRGSWFD